MQSFSPSISRRACRCCALAATLLLAFTLAGCGDPDPLPAIRQQQLTGDFEGTLEPLRKLLKEDPDDPELNFLYGRALSMTHGSNLAMWSLRKAMKDPDWLIPAASQLTFMALAGADFNEAVKMAGLVLEHEPDNARALLYRASAYAHWKKAPELAIADAERALEIDPNLVEAYEPMIIALLDLDRNEEAVAMLEEAGRKVKEIGTSEQVLAWHCATTAIFEEEFGDMERAGELWDDCLEAHPLSLDVLSNAVSYLDGQQKPDRSLEIMREAYAAAPGSRAHRKLLTDRLISTGGASEAEEILMEGTQSEEPALAAAAWMDLVRLHQALGQYGEAAEALERVVEFSRETAPPSPQLLFEYADALLLAKQLDRALEAAEALPVPAHRHLIRARVAQERRDPAKALEEFDETLLLWPDNPWARYYTALAAEELGDFDRALAEYRYSVRIAPEATDSRTRGARLLMADGKAAPAFTMIRTGGAGEAPPEIDGQMLFMRISAYVGDLVSMQEQLLRIQTDLPGMAGMALAEAAKGLSLRARPSVVLSMLVKAPGIDYSEVRYAPALRVLVQMSHAAKETAATRDTLEAIFAAHPETSAFQEIRGFDLELSGASAASVREAYERALELNPDNFRALESMGRLTFDDDPGAALAYFERAAAADPSDPNLRLQVARALIASDETDRAAQWLDELLLEFPYEAEAAAERAQLDLERGIATPQTLERARRAVRFGRRVEDFELLSQVLEKQGDREGAARAAERAQALREAQASRIAGGEAGAEAATSSDDEPTEQP